MRRANGYGYGRKESNTEKVVFVVHVKSLSG
jgi:hypothetical protein